MMPGFHVGALLLHRQSDAILHVARLGYRCVAIRPRPESLDPGDPQFGQQVVRMAAAIRQAGVGVVIDTDAMFMHDPLTAEMPSLAAGDPLEADMAVQWARRWIDVAGELGADLITLSSGRSEPGGRAEPGEPGTGSNATEQSLERLSSRIDGLVQAATRREVALALRPRSGDAIATVAQFERLQHWLGQPDRLRLAADIGEMLLGHEFPVGDRLARHIEMLGCVYLCDHRPGMAGDRRIGHGDVAVARIASTLASQGFAGPVIVRVDGHSDLGMELARESREIFDALA
jgi:sugar phosphate isomerase/epimerase